MSGAKSGGIGFGTCLFIAGAPVVLAVVGTGYLVGAAVQAYVNARNRINHEREQAMCEQRADVTRLMDAWKEKLAATENAMPPKKIRSVDEGFASTVSAGPVTISGSAEDELKGYIPDQKIEAPDPSDDQWRHAERMKCQDVINNMEEIVRSMTEPLSDNIALRIRELQQINDAESLAGCALQIRMEINQDVQRIISKREEDKAKARKMLDDLPEDCPPDARVSFQYAADGSSPLTAELQQLYKDLKQTQRQRELEQKEVDLKNREIVSNVLRSTLEEMGYEVGCVGNNLFANGSEAYIRNDQWDEGYCVNLRIVKDRVHFRAVKDGDSNREHDESMERAWKSEFEHVTERLNKANIIINDITVGSEPGDVEVLKKNNIPISTKKKWSTSATAETTSANQYAKGRTI